MFKNFSYFSKYQRLAIFALLILIVAIFLADKFMEKIFTAPASFYDEEFSKAVCEFEDEIFADTADFFEKEREFSWQKYEKNWNKKWEKDEIKAELFEFDPNELDSAGFARLGLKKWVISNILKYRKKGGDFRTAEDFSKLYGLDSQYFAILKPFILIKEKEIPEEEKIAPIELNSADTTALMKVPKMRISLAKRIVAFRNVLGGFADKNQLYEVRDVDSAFVAKILPLFTLETAVVKRLEVNKASVNWLKRHPYLNFYQAKAIYDLRRAKGKLSDISELSHLTEFSEKELEKLEPYLDFK